MVDAAAWQTLLRGRCYREARPAQQAGGPRRPEPLQHVRTRANAGRWARPSSPSLPPSPPRRAVPVVLGGAAFAFVKLRGHKSLQGWKKEALDGHGLPVHQTPPAAGAGNGSTTGGAVYQPARLPMEPEVPGFDGVEAAARQ